MELSKDLHVKEHESISSRKRSVLKTISWRVVATLTTLGLVYSATGKLEIAGAVAGIEVILKMVLYYAHERVWDKFRF
ncbi:hypothetical protein BHF71_01000 [Vulcanibacillus modesticaldus]|uniref:DUF2061 domain-containing protein n=1 Tax=Vulcanibacillus modesticaldus TaxID=337097 RepID=A0A1D2YVX6_9BACI|nr:DUF2061 domain-containing protein [Vulcanibacillus modesticaldus]OEF99785.1 hypothetical protein BHF71_01000 [Vulcanibacillus modesticaldus]